MNLSSYKSQGWRERNACRNRGVVWDRFSKCTTVGNKQLLLNEIKHLIKPALQIAAFRFIIA